MLKFTVKPPFSFGRTPTNKLDQAPDKEITLAETRLITNHRDIDRDGGFQTSMFCHKEEFGLAITSSKPTSKAPSVWMNATTDANFFHLKSPFRGQEARPTTRQDERKT